MEGIYHIHIVQICGSRLVCQIDGMLERKIPYRKCLELRISCLDAAQIFMIELGEAGRHLARAGTGSRHHDERTRGFDIFIATEAVFADYIGYIVRISVDRIVTVYLDAEGLQLVLKKLDGGLMIVARDHDASDVETVFLKYTYQAQHIPIVCDTKILAYLVALDRL